MLLPYSAFPRIAAHMIDRALGHGARILFFPDSGAIPLYECAQRLIACGYGGVDARKLEFRASKITAHAKVPLSIQLLGLLSVPEQNTTLKPQERKEWQKLLHDLPNEVQKRISNIPQIANVKTSKKELVLAIADIGIHLDQGWQAAPDDRLFECRNNSIILKRAPVTNGKGFEKRKVRAVTSTLLDILTKHDTRPLLQLVLSGTSFGNALQQGTVYVCDDAISRGRSLLTLDLVFRSFSDAPQWHIGVCTSPVAARKGTVLDFVAGNRLSPFMNRPDLIGRFIVASTNAWVSYTPEKLFGSHQLTRQETTELGVYDRESQLFLSKTHLPPRQESETFDLKTGSFLLNFCFVGGNAESLSHYINMNPVNDPYIAEGVLLYLRMPHPLSSITKREHFQTACVNLYNRFQSEQQVDPTFRANWKSLQKRYRRIRHLFLARERAHWEERRKEVENIWRQSFYHT